VVRLAAALARRGHRIMTIKHGSHTFNIDPATTDTYRHYHEGEAERVAMVSPDKFALVMRWEAEVGPREIAARYMADADLVLCEGFKGSDLPRIEVFRVAAHPTPLYQAGAAGTERWEAIVTDDPTFRAACRVVRFDDEGWLDQLADVAESVMQRQG
jgi:molybdopterin-guanine dinucleotide biosynthesis protein MobB